MTESVKNELSEICRIIDDTVDTEKIYLFGSYAYGTPNRDSDYDLCVIIPENSMRPADAVKAIRRALFSVQSVPLDVIVYRSGAFRQRADVLHNLYIVLTASSLNIFPLVFPVLPSERRLFSFQTLHFG